MGITEPKSMFTNLSQDKLPWLFILRIHFLKTFNVISFAILGSICQTYTTIFFFFWRYWCMSDFVNCHFRDHMWWCTRSRQRPSERFDRTCLQCAGIVPLWRRLHPGIGKFDVSVSGDRNLEWRHPRVRRQVSIISVLENCFCVPADTMTSNAMSVEGSIYKINLWGSHRLMIFLHYTYSMDL